MTRRLTVALGLTLSFMIVEVVGGLLSGSLALLADAAHMLTDAAALGIALLAQVIARSKADLRRTYGYRRAEVLAAWVNGIGLAVLGGWIIVEAVERVIEPQTVLAGTMLAVAAGGLAINLIVLRILHGGRHDESERAHGAAENINVRGAALHVLGDLFASGAAVIAAGVIWATGWPTIDPLLSVVVAGMVLWGAWTILSRTTHILLEGTPEGLDIDLLRQSLMREVEGLENVHHVHAWSVTTGQVLITLHVRLSPDAPPEADMGTIGAIKKHLARDFGIRHSVVQVERGACPD